MKMRLRLAAIVAVGGLAVSVSPSIGQVTPNTSNTQSQATVSPLAAPRKAVLDAQLRVNSLNTQIAQIRMRVQATFESKPDWVAAKKAVADAQGKYDAALKPVMDALQANPDYQQLVTNRKTAQAKLEELRSQPSATDSEGQKSQDDELSQAAGDVLTDGFAMNKMEREARDNDATLSAAKEELSDAKKAMDALQDEVTAAMQSDPQYQSVETQLTAAQQQLTSARAALIAAQNAQRPATPTPTPTATSSRGNRRNNGNNNNN